MARLFCILLGIALFQAGLLCAQDPLFPKSSPSGVVKKVDIEVGTITIRPSRKDATEDETFSLLGKDIDVITPFGQKAQLAAIAHGQTVYLKVDLAGDVEAILIQNPAFLATVLDVDPKNRTITLAGQPNQPKPSTTMSMDPNAKIFLAGRAAFLREVKPGSQMNVTASLDGKTALALKLVSDPGEKIVSKLFPRVKTSRLPGSRWVGTLTDVDPAKNELQLTGPKTKGVPKAMSVAKEAVIQLMYGNVPVQELFLNQIVKTAHATVLISPQDQQITRILVESPSVPGKVKAMDGDRGYLTVEMDGKEKVFALQRDFKVMDKARVRRLADLQPNMVVSLVLSLDREQLLAVSLDVR